MYKFTVTYFISAWCQPLISIYTPSYIPSHQRFSTWRVLGQWQTWLMQILWFFSSFFFRHFYWIFHPREFVACVLAFLSNVPILSDSVAMELGKNYWLCIYCLISVHVNQSSFWTFIQKAHTELMNLPNQIKFYWNAQAGFQQIPMLQLSLYLLLFSHVYYNPVYYCTTQPSTLYSIKLRGEYES